MTEYVALHRTSRGPGSNNIVIAAGNGAGEWNAQTSVNPPMVQVVSGDDYILSRWAAAVAWLNRWPESESGPLTRAVDGGNGDAGSVETINAATIAVAHWGLETGWGANEWNWNAGGIHCAANSEFCFRESEAGGGESFLSFDSFAAFLSAYFELVSRTPDYQPAWEAMKEGSANAILRLWRADYACGAKTASEATSLALRVRRVCVARFNEQTAALMPTETQVRATESNVPNRCTSSSRNRGSSSGSGSGSGVSSSTMLGLAAIAALVYASNK